MQLTEAQVKEILPSNAEYKAWTVLLNKFLPKYGITSDIRVAMFISQCSHESNQFKVLKENLNYSAQSLQTTFKKYFPNAIIAEQYARKPEKIANYIYKNRMNNGNETSGDGWKFRGKGLIMLTGRANVTAFALSIRKSVDETSLYLESKEGALCGSLFWWEENQLNSFADAKDIRGASIRVNGGTIGLSHREAEYKRISAILSRTNML